LQAADFINKLLQRKPINRLGLNGPNELKSHPWLKDFNLAELLEMKIKAPFVPSNKDDNIDIKNISENWKDDEQVIKQHALLLKQPNIQMLFKDYYYDYNTANTANAHSTAQQSTAEEKAERAERKQSKTAISSQLLMSTSSKPSASSSVLSNAGK
jgi:hypothetical protein